MYIAKTENGYFMNLAQYTREELIDIKKKHQFFCARCNEQVLMKIGRIKKPHFAHRHRSTCSKRDYSEGDYHRRGKQLIHSWLKNQGIDARLEHYIKEINRTPDIYFEIGRTKIVIEYQCSIISQEELSKRIKHYQQMNIEQIWILGGHLLKRRQVNIFSLTSFLKYFMHQFNQRMTPTLYFFCPNQKRFAILKHLYAISVNHVYGEVQFYHMTNMSFMDLFKASAPNLDALRYFWLKEKRKFRLHQKSDVRRHKDWRTSLYQASLHETILPSYVYLPIENSSLINLPPWYWQGQIALRFILPNKTFSLQMCLNLFKKSVFIQPPLMKEIENPVKMYLSILEHSGMITKVADQLYRQVQQFACTHSVHEMMKFDERFMLSMFHNSPTIA